MAISAESHFFASFVCLFVHRFAVVQLRWFRLSSDSWIKMKSNSSKRSTLLRMCLCACELSSKTAKNWKRIKCIGDDHSTHCCKFYCRSRKLEIRAIIFHVEAIMLFSVLIAWPHSSFQLWRNGKLCQIFNVCFFRISFASHRNYEKINRILVNLIWCCDWSTSPVMRWWAQNCKLKQNQDISIFLCGEHVCVVIARGKCHVGSASPISK